MKSKHGAYAFIVLLLLPCLLSAQTEQWVYLYDGSLYERDEGHALVYGTDNNIYVTGVSRNIFPFTNYDFIILSIDTAGNERWVYTYNGSGGLDDIGQTIGYGLDNNIYAAGYSYDSITDYDICVISLDTAGSERWVYHYNGPDSAQDAAVALAIGQNGNIYVAGLSQVYDTDYDLCVISLDTAGTEQWVYRYAGLGTSYDAAQSILYGVDNNLYVAGISIYADGFIVVSLDTTGNERWVYNYGTDAGANAIVQSPDSILYCAGNFGTGGYSYNIMAVCLNPEGSEQWVYMYDGPAHQSDEAADIACSVDGYLYIAGKCACYGTLIDATVISLDTSGTEHWVYRYDGSGTTIDVDQFNTIVCASDHHIYAAGESDEGINKDDILVVCLDTAGTEQWVYTHNGYEDWNDKAFDMVYGLDNIVYTAGVSVEITSGDIIVISLNPLTSIKEQTKSARTGAWCSVPVSFFKDHITIEFASSLNSSASIYLYDICGSRIGSYFYPCVPQRLDITNAALARLPGGVYFVSVRLDEKVYLVSKLIKIK